MEGVGHFEHKFQTWGASPTNHCWCIEWLSFRAVSKYPQCIVWFCHKTRVWRTDGLTDRHNYDSQYRASIAAFAVKTREIKSCELTDKLTSNQLGVLVGSFNEKTIKKYNDIITRQKAKKCRIISLSHSTAFMWMSCTVWTSNSMTDRQTYRQT